MPQTKDNSLLQRGVAAAKREKEGGGEPPSDYKKRSRMFALLLSVGFVGAVVCFGVPLWMGRSGDTNSLLQSSQMQKRVVAEPTEPPPPFSPRLAIPADGPAPPPADFARHVAAAVKDAETVLAALPIARRAPSELIAAPGVQRPAAAKDAPPYERWEIEFPPGNTVESYARQLDYFGIELGIVGGSSDITYLTSVSDPTPEKRTAPAIEESRLYLVWNRGAMREADQQLVARAKLQSEGKVIVHFINGDLEAELLRLEEAEAAQRGFKQVRKTTFGIRSNGFGGFQFSVLDQQGTSA